MHAPHPLLVAFDGTPCSEAASAWARRLAPPEGPPTLLLHALRSTDEAQAAQAHHAAELLLVKEARRYRTPVAFEVVHGAVASTVAEVADRIDAEPVLFGTRGRGPLLERLLGSNTRDLLTTLQRPVLVAHRPPESPRRVLAAVDSGSHSQIVAHRARWLAERLGAELTLATVIDVDRGVAENPLLYGITAGAWRDATQAWAGRVFEPLRRGGSEQEVVSAGDRVEELLRLAGEEAAEIVVVGRRGRSGVGVEAWSSLAFRLASRGPFATLVV